MYKNYYFFYQFKHHSLYHTVNTVSVKTEWKYFFVPMLIYPHACIKKTRLMLHKKKTFPTCDKLLCVCVMLSVLCLEDYRLPSPAAENMKINIKLVTPTWGSWIQEVRALAWTPPTPTNTRKWLHFLLFCVPAFGTTSKDDSLSRQNGLSQNRHLKEAHQVLDRNLGKQKQQLLIIVYFNFNFPRWTL